MSSESAKYEIEQIKSGHGIPGEQAELRYLDAAIEELRKWATQAIPYMRHKWGCPVTMTGAPDCYCGLEELLKKAPGPEAK